MVKLGIVGLGKMGGYHASACKLIPSVNLIGVADPNPKLWDKVKSTNVIKSKD